MGGFPAIVSAWITEASAQESGVADKPQPVVEVPKSAPIEPSASFAPVLSAIPEASSLLARFTQPEVSFVPPAPEKFKSATQQQPLS